MRLPFVVLFSVICSIFISSAAYSYVDLSLNYTQSIRKIDGLNADGSVNEEEAAETSTKGWTVNWAWYIWEYTALEFNYGETETHFFDNREVIDGSLTVKETETEFMTKISGAGIRQAFASRKAAIIPSIAIGYAKYTTSGTRKYLLNDGSSDIVIESETEPEEYMSSYAAASLKFRLTQYMGISFSAKTVMPDFKTSEAENNVTYSAGFNWMF